MILRIFSLFAILLMGSSWLIPNHYLPWLSFYNEIAFSGGIGLLCLVFLWQKPGFVKWPLIAIFFVFLGCVPILQVTFGLIDLGGAGSVASLYVVGFSLCIVFGYELFECQASERLQNMALVVLVPAVVSVGIALYQWQQFYALGDWIVNMEPNGRPYANLAQPNHLATFLYWGVIALLLLFQQRCIGAFVLAVGVAFLGAGIALTQSRTGLLECFCFGGMVLALKKRTGLRVNMVWVAFSLLLLVVVSLYWRSLDQWAVLSQSTLPANGGARLSVGTRPDHWLSILDAISRQPWLGYGWDQVSKAHLSVALAHPAMTETQAHSHNLVLDLLVWNGVPLGLLVFGVVVYWLIQQFRSCRSAEGLLLLAAVVGVLLHGLLEYPLEYAYFLLPTGLMMGAIERLNSNVSCSIVVPKRLTKIVFGVVFGLVGLVAVEYSAAEAAYRNWRLHTTRVVSVELEELPNILFLTQLRDFLVVVRSDVHSGMSGDELMRMRAVAFRYMHPELLMQYAVANALNNKPDEAATILQVICKRYRRSLCEFQLKKWRRLARDRYPVLNSVTLPKDHGVD